MADTEVTQHTFKKFDAELESLVKVLSTLSEIAEKNVKNAVKATLEDERRLAEKSIINHNKAKSITAEIDEQAVTLIAKRQPVAYDLRLILAITHAAGYLERISYKAKKIANKSLNLSANKNYKKLYSQNIAPMVETGKIFKKTIRAFRDQDTETAALLNTEKSTLDEAFKNATQNLLELMEQRPKSITLIIDFMKVLRDFESIATDVNNFNRLIIYMAKE